MKILLLSDTHSQTSAAIRLINAAGDFDLFFHMGDTYSDAVRIHQETALPMRAVSGNSDGYRMGPEIEIVDAEGYRCILTHGDLHSVGEGLDRLELLAVNMQADIVCFGHTHRVCDISRNGIRFLNPGHTKGLGGTFGILTLEKGVPCEFTVHPFA